MTQTQEITSRDLVVTLPKPHEAQQKVLGEAKRFNVLCMGRRWGKTTLSVRLTKEAILSPQKIGFFAPTYKDLAETWLEVKNRLLPIVTSKDEKLMTIDLINGSRLDFWSMENPDSGRGRKYHKVIIDEFEKAPKAEQAWLYSIRPMLADYMGEAWFLSTPRGTNTYFHQLYRNKEKFDNWASWQMPTATNPYIAKSEIAEAKAQLHPVIFKQEFEAQFVTMGEKPFLYAFEDRHIDSSLEIDRKNTVNLSFDFNVDPVTCIVGQHTYDKIMILDEFRLRNSNIHELCAQIMGKYGQYFLNVTGDATGLARNVATKGNINNYTIILKELGLTQKQLLLPGQNPPVSESRTLCNSVLSTFPKIAVHPRCEFLIEDLRFCQVDKFGQLDKKDDLRTHLLDTFRYYLNTFFGDYVRQWL